jgi:nitroimidazol reductase NimA-like FMN-containing flavoprotein (pyridoxamine 5'-phosphate oxidase superfamily)
LEAVVEKTAVQILDSHRLMAISTVRPDGWPQTTIVGYANNGLRLYFVIFRSSQKLANIQRDDRVSIAVGDEPRDFQHLTAVFAGAHAYEVKDASERELAWQLLTRRHPNLADFGIPDETEAALMCASCKHVSVLDYSKGFGHTDSFTVGDGGVVMMHPAEKNSWGISAAKSA